MSLSAHHHYLEEIDAFFNSIDHNEGEKHYAIILACFLQDEGIETQLFSKFFDVKIWIETDALTKDGVEKNLLLCENYVELDGLVFIGQKWHEKSEVIPYLQSFFMEQENASSVEVTELADMINPPSIRNWVSSLAKKWRSEWESHCLMQASDSPQKLKETRRL